MKGDTGDWVLSIIMVLSLIIIGICFVGLGYSIKNTLQAEAIERTKEPNRVEKNSIVINHTPFRTETVPYENGKVVFFFYNMGSKSGTMSSVYIPNEEVENE